MIPIIGRRSAACALLTVATLVFDACANSPTPSLTTSAGPSGPPTSGVSAAGASPGKIPAQGDISAFGVSYETGDVMARARIDLFTKDYPDVNVTFSESSFDPQKFLSALESSNRPDIVRIPRDRLGTYVARGVLEPLDDCISRAGMDMSNYYDSAVKQVTIDGRIYGVPEFFWTSNWLIDDDLFKQAGLTPATWDVGNWDQIKTANDALINKTEATVAIDPKVSDNGDLFPLWVAAAGGQMISDDGKESRLDTPQVADALNFTKSLIDAQGGLATFKEAIAQTGTLRAGDEFSKNVEAAFPVEQSYLNVLAGTVPTTKFTARPFMATSGQPMTYEEGDALAIVSTSDNKDAACAFVTEMVSSDAWIAAATQSHTEAVSDKTIQAGWVTGNRAADEQIFSSIVDLSGIPTFRNAVDAYNSTFDYSFGMPATRAAEEFRTAWTDAINAVLSGDKDAQTALKGADQTAQDAIDSAAQ
jgi:multiple sugar transport system substrate-binding protein